MNKPVLTSLALTLALGTLGTTGCASIRTRQMISAEEKTQALNTTGLKEVGPKEAKKLAEVLTGEVQTVYPSDNGLARVFGQVANLGETPYKRVRFDLVAVLNEQSSDATQEKVVGTFVIENGLKPGQIEPFDVQTAASMGDVKNLEVRVGALQ